MKRYIRSAVRPISDESDDVKLWLAKNERTSPRDLVELLDSPGNFQVLRDAAQNPSLPQDIKNNVAPKLVPHPGDDILIVCCRSHASLSEFDKNSITRRIRDDAILQSLHLKGCEVEVTDASEMEYYVWALFPALQPADFKKAEDSVTNLISSFGDVVYYCDADKYED